MIASLVYEPLLRIHIGPLAISPHGIMTAVGVLVGLRILLPAAAKAGIDTNAVIDVVTKAVLAAMVGARVAYVLNHLGSYRDAPLDAFKPWEGGLSLLGGLVAAGFVGVWSARRAGVPVRRLVDLAAPGLAVGIAVGRIGDLIIADHLGKPTDFALGYACPAAKTGSPCIADVGEAVHQTALYDMVAAAAIAVVLFALRRRVLPRGALGLTFVVLYGFARFVEGFFRIDVTHGTGLNGSQWTALVAGVSAAIALAVLLRRSPRDHERLPPPGDSDDGGAARIDRASEVASGRR